MSENNNNNNSNSTTRSKGYLIYLIIILIIFEILDNYTQFFLMTIPSEIKKSFLTDYPKNIADSIYAIIILIATLGTYVAFLVWYLTDKIGRKPLLVVSTIGFIVGSVGILLATNIIEFAIYFLIIWTFGTSDIWIIYINEEAPKEKKGFWSNFVLAIGFIGVFMIPAMRAIFVTETSPVGAWKGMAWFPIILGIPLLIIIIFTIKETSKFEEIRDKRHMEKKKRGSMKENLSKIFKNPNRLAIISIIFLYFIRGINFFTRQMVEIVLTETFNLAPAEFNILFVIMSISTLLSMLITGKLSDKVGRKKMLSYLSLSYIIGNAILMYVLLFPTNDAYMLILLAIFMCLTNIGFFGLWVFLSIVLIELTPTEDRGSANAIKLFLGAVATTIGLVLAAIITLFIGLVWAMIILGFLFIFNFPLIYRYVTETKGTDLSKVTLK